MGTKNLSLDSSNEQTYVYSPCFELLPTAVVAVAAGARNQVVKISQPLNFTHIRGIENVIPPSDSERARRNGDIRQCESFESMKKNSVYRDREREKERKRSGKRVKAASLASVLRKKIIVIRARTDWRTIVIFTRDGQSRVETRGKACVISASWKGLDKGVDGLPGLPCQGYSRGLLLFTVFR